MAQDGLALVGGERVVGLRGRTRSKGGMGLVKACLHAVDLGSGPWTALCESGGKLVHQGI